MCTQRRSISAVCGYSSLSIMFLSIDSVHQPWTAGSSHVWQNVARFWRELPSSISSSAISWNTGGGCVLVLGEPVLGQRVGELVAGKERIVELVADGLTFVQRHLGFLWPGRGHLRD